MHSESVLQQKRRIIFAGTYRVLPSCIEDLAGPPEPPPPAQQAATMRLMDHILRVTLLQVCSVHFASALHAHRKTLRLQGVQNAALCLMNRRP